MKVVVNETKLDVGFCNTPESIAEGMSGKNFDTTFKGMLFKMPSVGIHSFWTYKCIVSLDIIFINKGIITKIYSNCTPCNSLDDCPLYKGYGDHILELKGGFCSSKNIKQGDVVEIKKEGHGKSTNKSVARRANARSCTAVFKTS